MTATCLYRVVTIERTYVVHDFIKDGNPSHLYFIKTITNHPKFEWEGEERKENYDAAIITLKEDLHFSKVNSTHQQSHPE